MTVEKNNVAADDGKITYHYKISTDEKIVDPNSIQVTLGVRDSVNNNVEKILTLTSDKHWEYSFSPTQSADYRVTIHAQGEMLDGSELDETISAETFTYTEKKHEEAPVKKPAVEAAHAEEKPVKVEAPAAEESKLLLYVSIIVGNLLAIVLGYLGYKKISGGKKNDELSEVEKVLALEVKAVANKTAEPFAPKKPPEKMEIDLSEENPAHIPMNDESSMDNLFPLDNMEDTNKNDDED